MSFFVTSEGENLTDSDGKFDVGGGGEPIPEGSSVMAMPTEAKWKEWEGTESIGIQWQVMKPEEYANRRVFQTLYVTDLDTRAKNPTQKRDKALRMLAAIDKNAGGKLTKKGGRPSDVDLMGSLCGKPMILKLGIFNEKNYVQAVAPKEGGMVEIKEAKPKPAQRPSQSSYGDDLDSEVPF